MGSVYQAEDKNLADSPCAIKEIHRAAKMGPSSDYIEGRFIQEMKSLVALDHGSIPKVRDFFRTDQILYLVMELVSGRSLDEEIKQRKQSGQPAPVESIVEDMLAVLEILDYLHNLSPPLVHRDIKPANLLRDERSGRIKLVDFGLIRAVEGEEAQSMVGTLGYGAPEQLAGRSSPRSDLYALGVTMYHLLTGLPPDLNIFECRRPQLQGVRPGLSEIVARATWPEPEQRFGSAREMAEALRAWLADNARSAAANEAARPDLGSDPSRPPVKPSGVAGQESPPAVTGMAMVWLVGLVVIGFSFLLGMWLSRHS